MRSSKSTTLDINTNPHPWIIYRRPLPTETSNTNGGYSIDSGYSIDASATPKYKPQHLTHNLPPRPQVSELINSSKLTDGDRLRLVTLFALRYEQDGRPQISSLIQRCQEFGMPLQQMGAVRSLLLHAGDDRCALKP